MKTEQEIIEELLLLRKGADELSANFKKYRDEGDEDTMQFYRELFQLVDKRITTLEWVLNESDVKSFARF